MFRAMISPIFRSNSLSGSGGTPLPGYRPATSWMHYTTSCNTDYCSWRWEKSSPETCWADWNY